MQIERIGLVGGVAGLVLAAVVAASGGKGAADGGADADRDVWTTAQQCCVVVQKSRACTFSAATCSSLEGAARPAYACRTFLWVTREAWKGNPPPECR